MAPPRNLKPAAKAAPAETSGAMHDIECNGEGFQGNGCNVLVPTWLPKKLPRNFKTLQFLCGYCAAKTTQHHSDKFDELVDRIEKLEGEANTEPSIPDSVNEAVTLDNLKQEGLQKVIRITSVPETENEDLTQVVLNVANAMTVTLQRDEVVKAYRSGRRRSSDHNDVSADSRNPTPRSIVVELKSLDSKIKLLVNKKKLQEAADYETIHLKGELTYLRWKLYYYLIELNTTDKVFCKRGKLYVTMKDKSVFPNDICVESVKDLHRIGVNSVDYSVLGFPSAD